MSKELVASFEGELPQGWTTATIGDLISSDGVFIDGDWVESKDQDPNGDVRLIQLADVADGFYKDKSARFLTKESALKLNCTFLKKGDVLIARMPDPLGRACIFPGDAKESVTVVDVCVVRSGTEEISNKWIMYWVNSPRFRNTISSLQSGTTRRRISRGNLATITFPFPPPEQQKRIVAKIEELFSQIDAGIEALKKAKQLLKQYRQSVLKAAVTGELTKEWREANKDSNSTDWLRKINSIREDLIENKEIIKPKKTTTIVKSEVPYQIPETWEWIRLNDFVLTSVDCPHSTAKYKEQGKKCIRTSDFLPGKLVLDKVRYVTKEEFDERNKRLIPQQNDVLYSREGGILGIACMIPEGEELCLGQRMMIFRTDSKMSSTYLMHNLNSPLIVNRIKSLISGSASPHLNVGEIRNFMLPIPSKDECAVLLLMLDEKLISIERLEHEISLQLVKANKKKQSILASAFAGKLD